MEDSRNHSSMFCRICHEECDTQDSPCHCTGSLLVHLACLEKWLSINKSGICELCGFQFTVRLRNRTYVEWLAHLGKDKEQRRYVVCDIASFVLLTPLLVFSFIMCIVGYHQYRVNGSESEANSLLVLSLLIVGVYLLWTYLVATHNYREFKHWQSSNPEAKLLTTCKEENV